MSQTTGDVNSDQVIQSNSCNAVAITRQAVGVGQKVGERGITYGGLGMSGMAGARVGVLEGCGAGMRSSCRHMSLRDDLFLGNRRG